MAKDKDKEKDYEFTRTRIGKEDPWYKPDPADYRQKVGRPGMAGIGGYERYDYNKSYSKYRSDFKAYKEKKKALKAGTYKYKDNTKGAIERLRDNGIDPVVARAFGSAAGIKVINSQEDARGILNQFGRAQGDYTDEQIKKHLNNNKSDGSSQTPNKPRDEYPISEEQARVNQREQDTFSGRDTAETFNPNYRADAQSFLDRYKMNFMPSKKGKDLSKVNRGLA